MINTKSKKSQTKFVKCYFCGKEIEVYFRCSNTLSICQECKDSGKKSPIFNEESIEKRKRTCLEKYGYEYITQTKQMKEKARQTCLEKYGEDNFLKTNQGKEKYRKTCLEKYGTDNVFKSKKIKEKIKKVNIEKYGTDNPAKSEFIKSKINRTILQKYGVENVSKINETKEKKKETCLKNFGVEHPGQSEEVKKKIRKTNLEKYNCEYNFQVDHIKDKIKKTCLEKYGVEYALQSKQVLESRKQTSLKKFLPKLYKSLEYLDLELLDEYFRNNELYKFRCKRCGTVFNQIWNSIQQGYKCPICYPRYESSISRGEKEVLEFIATLFNKNSIISNCRFIIAPLELDIYIPDKQVAIEYNGLYWHSEEIRTDPNYHLNKTNECEKKGIYLIHIFEDEWIMKQEIVKSRLKQILNISDSEKIYARQCEIKEIEPKLKNEFLDEFHIQGHDSSSIKLGAFYKNELVSVMTFSKPNISKGQKTKEEGIWELNRFCSNSNYHVPGIASKLLTYFKRKYNWNQIYSYADRRWSNGNLYYKLGFELDHITQPNYWYLKDFERIHRFNLRKRPDEPKDIPEYILRLKEGYTRIWDCGNLKFVMDLNQKK